MYVERCNHMTYNDVHTNHPGVQCSDHRNIVKRKIEDVCDYGGKLVAENSEGDERYSEPG